MATQPTDQAYEEALVFTCSECGSHIRVESIPHVGAAIKCDCGDALGFGDFVHAFPGKWMNPGSLVERSFECREGDGEVVVAHIFDHLATEHDQELVEEYHTWGPSHTCHLCHHVFNLETNTPGVLLHLDEVHDVRVLEDEFYDELGKRRLEVSRT